jgi:hypothetical protein
MSQRNKRTASVPKVKSTTRGARRWTTEEVERLKDAISCYGGGTDDAKALQHVDEIQTRFPGRSRNAVYQKMKTLLQPPPPKEDDAPVPATVLSGT